MEDDKVKIRIYGPGYGESIVVYIPKIGWGVIDSCVAKNDNIKTNPALDYLISKKVPRLAFVILTHPHKDHYEGFDQIVTHYLGRIERVGYYAGTGIREYFEYLARNEILGAPGARKLSNVFKKFVEAHNSGAKKILISERTSIINTTIDGLNIEITALSPSATSQEIYRDMLFKAIPKKDGDTIIPLSDKHHNLISVAILIKVGDAKIVLGSDVENGNKDTGWGAIIDSDDLPDISSHLVKVPHHGSTTAFSDELWKNLTIRGSTISVITPYDKNLDPLPKNEIIAEIDKYSEIVAITAAHKFIKPKNVYNRTAISNFRGVVSWNCLVENNKIGFVDIDLSTVDGKLTYNVAPPAFIYQSGI